MPSTDGARTSVSRILGSRFLPSAPSMKPATGTAVPASSTIPMILTCTHDYSPDLSEIPQSAMWLGDDLSLVDDFHNPEPPFGHFDS